MAARPWYPIFLDLEGKRVLVVGGGTVALRKTRGLLEAGARVSVVAIRFAPEFEELPVERIQRSFEDDDIKGAALVFAATDSREVNQRVGQLAGEHAVPANIADSPSECAFIVPAQVHHEGLQIAISTGGTDPSRAARVRRELEQCLGLMRP
jgi:precorrin-2 dehydrogenase / sirohydrochlorin ferrochelatase